MKSSNVEGVIPWIHIARLASLKYQERFVIHGNKNNYMTIDELVQEFRLGENEITSRLEKGLITEKQADIARKFIHVFKSVLLESDFLSRYWKDTQNGHRTVADIIYNDSGWLQIRELARRSLREFGISDQEFEQWESGEIERFRH